MTKHMRCTPVSTEGGMDKANPHAAANEEPKRIYHGTTEAVARAALVEGLRSRATTGGAGNWEHTVSSNADLVYLTTAYPLYFAGQAARNDENWGIIEIDLGLLDDALLRPDEDYMALELGEEDDGDIEAGGADTLNDRVRRCRQLLDEFSYLWPDSLSELGNVAYAGIVPPSAVTRVAIFDPRSNLRLALAAMDANISPLAYKVCGKQHRDITRWLMGNSVKPEDMLPRSLLQPDDPSDEILVELRDERLRFWRNVFGDRSGIELLPGAVA